jgi:mono/diheme cytochrome c family protein
MDERLTDDFEYENHSQDSAGALRTRAAAAPGVIVPSRVALLASALLAALAGCAGQLPVLGQADAMRASQRWPGITVAELAHGRELYVNHCASCHKLYRPGEQPADKWRALVGEMTERAKLPPADAETIVRYLIAAAESPPTP